MQPTITHSALEASMIETAMKHGLSSFNVGVQGVGGGLPCFIVFVHRGGDCGHAFGDTIAEALTGAIKNLTKNVTLADAALPEIVA